MTDKILAGHYLKMMNELNKDYPCRNFFIWVSTFHKKQDKVQQGLEDNINMVWKECIAGDATLIKFLATLKMYKKGMGDLFRLYANRHKGRK